jgi:hypothetical protein
LDDDVAKLLERARKQRGVSLKRIVNEALRAGLVRLAERRPPRRQYATKAVSLGRCLLADVDDVAGALAAAEGERFR